RARPGAGTLDRGDAWNSALIVDLASRRLRPFARHSTSALTLDRQTHVALGARALRRRADPRSAARARGLSERRASPDLLQTLLQEPRGARPRELGRVGQVVGAR